jgi:hypothetical protein
MLMWIASLVVSLFHHQSPANLKSVRVDYPINPAAVAADQQQLEEVSMPKGDGYPWP